jgi:preprotein translocase subunit SecY
VKKLAQTFKNIWNIEELRSKIIVTLALVLTYRFGTHIVLPGINPLALDAIKANNKTDGLLGLFDAFAGGAFSQASILALGIMPYISASIFMQLMTILVPQLQKVQKEGESGRKKINQWTRYLTVIVTAFQAGAYIAYLNSPDYAPALIPAFKPFFAFSTIIILTAGTLFVMWLGEKIQDKGLGNGTSIIIMVGILARLPQSLLQEFYTKQEKGGGGLLVFLIEIAILVAIIMGLIILVQGVRKIPVNYAKQIIGNKQFGGARQFLPVKVNSAGVMPIIFAQAIMFIPAALAGLSQSETSQSIASAFSNMFGLWYNLVFALLIIIFTFFYTAITVPTNKMADDLKRSGGFIPGIKPGVETADFLDKIMSLVTFPGSLFLALIAVFPAIVVSLDVQQSWAMFYGGTSLIIMVGVAIDTIQQINTYLLNKHYDGLMKSGKNRKAVA